MKTTSWCVGLAVVLAAGCESGAPRPSSGDTTSGGTQNSHVVDVSSANGVSMINDGENVFRFDTFGDEAFWGGQLRLHEAIAKLCPKDALALGLKVDVDALTPAQRDAIKAGTIDLSDPAVTVALLQQKAVVGVTGFFDNHGTLTSVGIQCALCHSTVDNSLAQGIGHRIDGLANHDLDIGKVIASAPNLQPVVKLLALADPGITDTALRQVLTSWGPGKFDAEVFLDGKAMTPDGKPAATLIPNAAGLAGYDLVTWTGGWGAMTYWNAFVAVDEMHGIGTFFDARFDNAAQFPIAAKAGLGHVAVDPDSDRVTPKLGALQMYQLALMTPKPKAGVDFDADAAERGDALFSGKANCNSCHHEPLWSEPGWNQHTPDEMKIDSFQADRSPGHAYKTMNLAGVFVRERGLFMAPAHRGGFYHDGRFKTLGDVVDSYNTRFGLQLSAGEKSDLIEYLKSL